MSIKKTLLCQTSSPSTTSIIFCTDIPIPLHRLHLRTNTINIYHNILPHTPPHSITYQGTFHHISGGTPPHFITLYHILKYIKTKNSSDGCCLLKVPLKKRGTVGSSIHPSVPFSSRTKVYQKLIRRNNDFLRCPSKSASA